MTENTWNPNAYLRNAGLRTRPAVDLADRIPANDPKKVFDLGCGPGNSTAILHQKWPLAVVSGVDSSPEMISQARKNDSSLNWQVAGIENWRPDHAPDIIFANASLHWVHDHDKLFPRLLDMLAPGGTLAVQMPNNFNAYSHTNIDKSLKELGMFDSIADKLLGGAMRSVDFYHNLLRRTTSHLDIWETEYMQVLTGPDPVFKWVEATTLLPIKAHLSSGDYAIFCDNYKNLLRISYPEQPDGVTLFPFRRMFIIAQA